MNSRSTVLFSLEAEHSGGSWGIWAWA